MATASKPGKKPAETVGKPSLPDQVALAMQFIDQARANLAAVRASAERTQAKAELAQEEVRKALSALDAAKRKVRKDV